MFVSFEWEELYVEITLSKDYMPILEQSFAIDWSWMDCVCGRETECHKTTQPPPELKEH